MRKFIEEADKIHLIGIGGTGMSGLAKLFLDMKKDVSGSDNLLSLTVKQLGKKGIKIFSPQKESNITCISPQLVVYSHAIFPDNAEYKRAMEMHIPMLSYPQAVGGLMEDGKRGIAIAGTHGKTTTSSLIVSILQKTGYSPSFLLGGEIMGVGNSGVGNNDLLVVEACEYKRSFLNYKPEIAVVTGIEEDHLDYYKDINEIKEAFEIFIEGIQKKNGIVIYSADNKNLSEVMRKVKGVNAVSYSLQRGDWRAENIRFSGNTSLFDSFFKDEERESIELKSAGVHNVVNSLAAIACARHLGVPWEGIKKALAEFQGIHRRCEFLGKTGGVAVMDDYGHHPTEIKFTLKSVRNIYPHSRLIAVFQPHQYSRTRFLLKEFASSFSEADKVVVPDIYFVRDSIAEQKLVNAQILVEKIRNNGNEALYLPTFEEITEYLLEIAKPGDVIITIGAGPVNKIANDFLKKYDKKRDNE